MIGWHICQMLIILDTVEKLISIPFDSNYIITRAVVEQCTCKKQMNYKVSDLVYIQDIEALDKKINALAEVSHYNDVNMTSIQETYTTVNEVNEALSNYFLKTELNDYATTQYVKYANPSYSYLNKNYSNNAQLDNILNDYLLKTDIPAVDLSNYVLKSDYDRLAEKVIALENENPELKSQMNIFNDFMNSYEQNITTRPLIDSDLIIYYYDDYTAMRFNGKIESG